jgi:hypothetical protein
MDESQVPADDQAAEPLVTAHSCTPERTVFTEEGNADAWLATDLTVELER